MEPFSNFSLIRVLALCGFHEPPHLTSCIIMIRHVCEHPCFNAVWVCKCEFRRFNLFFLFIVRMTTSEPLSEQLLKVMESENRPCTFSSIHERLGKLIAKNSLQKAIDLQVASRRIIEKTYGKQKFYCVNNNLNKVNSEEVINCSFRQQHFRSNFVHFY